MKKETASGSLRIEGVTCAERRRLVQPPQPVGAAARLACPPSLGAAGPRWTFSGCLRGGWASAKGSRGRSGKTNQQQLQQFRICVYQIARSLSTSGSWRQPACSLVLSRTQILPHFLLCRSQCAGFSPWGPVTLGAPEAHFVGLPSAFRQRGGVGGGASPAVL